MFAVGFRHRLPDDDSYESNRAEGGPQGYAECNLDLSPHFAFALNDFARQMEFKSAAGFDLSYHF